MKIKHAKSILTRKIDHWLNSIDDNKLKEIIKDNAIVSGGAITSLLMGTKVNDFDIYFKTDQAAYEIAKYYVKKFQENPTKLFANKNIQVHYVTDPVTEETTNQVTIKIKSQGVSDLNHLDDLSDLDPIESDNDIDTETNNQIQDLNDNDVIYDAISNLREQTINGDGDDEKEIKDIEVKLYRPVYLTSNSITLKNKIQIVIRFTGEIEEIHKNYDFTHCKCAFDYKTKNMYIHEEALECMLNKELRYTTSRYPLCSIFRIRKFLERGWHINAGQILKMAWDLNKLDLKNIHVLKDQLIGVDHTYFQMIIEALEKRISEKEQTEDNQNFSIDEGYLYKLINYIF